MRYLLALLLVAAPLFAEGPEFEAATIKRFEPPKTTAPVRYGGSIGGPGTTDPTHMRLTAMPLSLLLMMAFDVKYFQLVDATGAGSQIFAFAAVVPAGATKDDVQAMWRNLLISRFGMKYHIEQRESQVDELVVGPRGHKLIESNQSNQLDSVTTSAAVAFAALDVPGMTTTPSPRPNGPPVAKVTAKAQPMSALASLLSTQLQSPVVDRTGLTGKYNFVMEYLPRMAGGVSTQVDDGAVDITSALQQQLGLRLVKGKSKIDVVIIDKLDRVPTEN
jgi:uncharacterized protein (TIGR03435 family)